MNEPVFSNCCYALPIGGEVDENGNDRIGRCSDCGKGAIFLTEIEFYEPRDEKSVGPLDIDPPF